MATTSNIVHFVEGLLYRRGFAHEDTRVLVRNQILLTGAVSILALGLGWRWEWLLDIAAGALLMTFNLYLLADFLQHVLLKNDGAVGGQLIRFYVRLIVTGVVLAALIIWAQASILALLLGLSTVVVTILIWGIQRMTGKPSTR